MRPDKKKKVHHDSVVKKKAALAKEAQKTGSGKEKENSNPPQPQGVAPSASEDPSPSPIVPPTFKGVRETGDKLINEANQRYLAAQTKEEEPKYAKRNITSNWTKFELPSSGDESGDDSIENMTGADFNYVLASASGAESHFRLKSEKEWDPDTVGSGGEFSNEFFSLDVIELERSLNCVPFPQHIGVKEEDFEPENLSSYKAKSARYMAGYTDGTNHGDVEKEINQKMMDILTIEKEESPQKIGTEITEVKKEKVKEKLVFPKPEVSNGLEKRHDTNGEITENGDNLEGGGYVPREEVPINSLNAAPIEQRTAAAPLEQRTGRRQRGAKKQDNKIETSEKDPKDKSSKDCLDENNHADKAALKDGLDKATSEDGLDEKSDLDFLDSIDKPKQNPASGPITPEEEKGGVVPVQIVKEKETEDLEDWLDDFLDD